MKIGACNSKANAMIETEIPDELIGNANAVGDLYVYAAIMSAQSIHIRAIIDIFFEEFVKADQESRPTILKDFLEHIGQASKGLGSDWAGASMQVSRSIGVDFFLFSKSICDSFIGGGNSQGGGNAAA